MRAARHSPPLSGHGRAWGGVGPLLRTTCCPPAWALGLDLHGQTAAVVSPRRARGGAGRGRRPLAAGHGGRASAGAGATVLPAIGGGWGRGPGHARCVGRRLLWRRCRAVPVQTLSTNSEQRQKQTKKRQDWSVRWAVAPAPFPSWDDDPLPHRRPLQSCLRERGAAASPPPPYVDERSLGECGCRRYVNVAVDVMRMPLPVDDDSREWGKRRAHGLGGMK